MSDSLLQTTCLGGDEVEAGFAIPIHSVTGDFYLGGHTCSTDLPSLQIIADATHEGINEGFGIETIFILCKFLPSITLQQSGFYCVNKFKSKV